jgi:hypothetical protein
MPPPYELRPAATPIEWWIIKGETYDIRVPVLDDDEQPVDVTGWTAKAQVRRSEREPVLHEWTGSTIECVGTEVVLHVFAAQTSAWSWDNALVSVEIYAPITGAPRVIAQGPIHALPEITR